MISWLNILVDENNVLNRVYYLMKENLAFLSITLGLILITQVKAAVNYTSFSPNGPVFTEVTCYYDIPSEGWSTPY